MKFLKSALVALAVASALSSQPAAALDPLSLMILRMLRDQLVSSQLEAALGSQSASPAPAPALMGYPRDLRTVVDEGFPDLNATQRKAVYDRFTELMNDPRNARDRDAMLNEFLGAASAFRATHEALAHLTDEQKRTIASQAAAAYRDKTPEALEEAIAVLRTSAMPIPADLRERMLAELTSESAARARAQ